MDSDAAEPQVNPSSSSSSGVRPLETAQMSAPTVPSATPGVSHPILHVFSQEEDDKKDELPVFMSVEPGRDGATSVSLSSMRNATNLLVDEPEASRVRVQQVMVDPKVLDLLNVDEES